MKQNTIKQNFKDFIKYLGDSNFIRTILAYICHIYIYFVYKTSTIIIKGDYQNILDYVKSGKGVVLMTWHGRILISPLELNRLFKNEIKKGKKLTVLASLHRDGKIASKTMSTFNVEVIEGSTINKKKDKTKSNNSITSIRHIMKSLLKGNICVLAADAPRGPKYKMNTKVSEIVKKTKTAIAYASISYKHKKQFNTWDAFQVPYPFNTITIEYGKLIQPTEDDDCEKINQELEKNLNKATKSNDKNI